MRIRKSLAEYAHAAWSGWMQYIFSKSHLQPDGTVIIPAELVQRWSRQMNTPYDNLPESEKKSDQEEAEKMMKIITENKLFREYKS